MKGWRPIPASRKRSGTAVGYEYPGVSAEATEVLRLALAIKSEAGGAADCHLPLRLPGTVNKCRKKSADSSCYRECLCLALFHSAILGTAQTVMTPRRDDNSMPPLPPIWRVRVDFVVALSLLSAVLLAPGTAQASCGSYVTFHSPSKNATQPVVPQTDFGQMPLADHSGKPRPCSGPTCSNRPVPPMPPVPSVRPAGDEASGIAAFTLAAETSFAPLAESLSPQHPLQIPRSIFHPPRLLHRSR